MRFAYVEGRDVLHGVDLDVGVGERIAMVGPSGAGKSTLGRLLAGIHPPRTGSVTVGGVGLTELPLTDLRGHVALVTQEHHVFVGTLRDNLALARTRRCTDDDLLEALDAVDARDWVQALPDGLDTVVGSGGRALTPAQAQQVALARLVLADPHTLVLDEATSLIDPRAARHLERSLAARAARPHGDRDRAPAVLRARRRPGGRGRGRPDHASSAPTTSWSRRAGPTPPCGRPGIGRCGAGEFPRYLGSLALPGACTPLEAQVPMGSQKRLGSAMSVCVPDARQVPRYLGNCAPTPHAAHSCTPEIATPERVLYALLIEISTAVSGSSWRAIRSRPAFTPGRAGHGRGEVDDQVDRSASSPQTSTSSCDEVLLVAPQGHRRDVVERAGHARGPGASAAADSAAERSTSRP